MKLSPITLLFDHILRKIIENKYPLVQWNTFLTYTNDILSNNW